MLELVELFELLEVLVPDGLEVPVLLPPGPAVFVVDDEELLVELPVLWKEFGSK